MMLELKLSLINLIIIILMMIKTNDFVFFSVFFHSFGEKSGR